MAKKMVVFVGSDEPQKAFPPFMLGSGAIAMDMKLMLFFTMSGLNIIKKGGAEKIKLELVACSAAFPIVGCKEEDLIEGVECGGVATFVDEAEEADIVLTFC
jgi:predicted peroxiredoxin